MVVFRCSKTERLRTLAHSVRLSTANLIFIAALSSAALAQPAVAVSPRSGPPYDKVTVEGAEFGVFEAVDIYFDTTGLALATTNPDGQFSGIGFTIPATARPGVHWISAVGRQSGLAAQTRFVVQTDWPQFMQGPQHHGYNPVENVLNVSNVGGLELRWSAVTLGQIYGQPVVANGLVYVGSGNAILYAFDAEKGSEIWDVGSGGLGVVASSMAVANGFVFANLSLFEAFNAATGAPVWRASIGSSVSTPAVANGVVYVGSGTQLIAEAKGKLYAFNTATGQLLWSVETSQIFSTPVVANGVVFASTLYDGLLAFNAASGQQLWSAPAGGQLNSSPAVANGVVYVGSGDGNLYAFNAATGQKLWSAATGGSISSSPAVAVGVVYVGSNDDNLYAFNAATGQKHWSTATGSSIESSAAVANGVVYIGSDDNNLYAFNAATGQELWSAATGSRIGQSAPTVVNGMVYVGSTDGKLYAFGLPAVPAPARPDPAALKPDRDRAGAAYR